MKREPAIERVMRQFVVDEESGCWLFTGNRDEFGYGRIGELRTSVRTHRVMWIHRFGAIPDGLCVLHRCDVPHCVNPEHLWLGTRAENNADCARKRRTVSPNSLKTHCVRGHPLSGDNLDATRLPFGERRCRACARVRNRGTQARRPRHAIRAYKRKWREANKDDINRKRREWRAKRRMAHATET